MIAGDMLKLCASDGFGPMNSSGNRGRLVVFFARGLGELGMVDLCLVIGGFVIAEPA